MDGKTLYESGEKKVKKNKRTLSDREKKLLNLLLIFSIIVVLGYYGVVPGSRVYFDAKKNLKSVTYVRDEYEKKASKITSLYDYMSRLKKKLLSESDVFYPAMTSDQTDALITGVALKCGLKIESLDVNPDAYPASLTAYQYAPVLDKTSDFDTKSGVFAVETAEEAAAKDKFALDSEIKNKVIDFSESVAEKLGDDYTDAYSLLKGSDEEDESISFEGVYVSKVNITASCSDEAYKKFVNTVYEKYPSIRIAGYDYTKSDEGESGIFTIELEVYMAA